MSNSWSEVIAKRHAALNDAIAKGDLNSPLLKQAREWACASGDKLSLDENKALVGTDDNKMSATFTITTARRDRHGDRVTPLGCSPYLNNYKTNPRVFFGHRSTQYPIGSARTPNGELALNVSSDKVTSTVYFHGKTLESEQVYELVAAKELETCSIGFLPYKAEYFDAERAAEKKDECVFDWGGLEFKEWDLLEWSIVAVPANADALANRLSKGIAAGRSLSPCIRKSLEAFNAPRPLWINGWTGSHALTGPNDLEALAAKAADLKPAPLSMNELRASLAAEHQKEKENRDVPAGVTVTEVPSPEKKDHNLPELEGKPLGCRVLSETLEFFCCFASFAAKAEKAVEQEAVKVYCGGTLKEIEKLQKEAKKLFKKLYPDYVESEPYMQDPATPAPVADAPDVPTPTAAAPATVVAAADPFSDPCVLAALEELKKNQKRLNDQFYALTGKDI